VPGTTRPAPRTWPAGRHAGAFGPTPARLAWATRRLVWALAATAALCACTALATAQGALARGGLAALQADLRHQLALGGRHDGAYVYDLTAKRALFAQRAAQLRPPASVQKLYTTTAALQLMGPAARLHTRVLGVGRLAPGGVWQGDLYLHGGGDPTFGSRWFIASHYGGMGASVSSLVAQLVHHDGIHRITGSVFGDDSMFDSRRGEPSSGYAQDPFLEGTLSALAFNRGAVGSHRGAHAPAQYAAGALWGALKSAGVSIHGHSAAATTPPGAVALAEVSSPSLAQLIGLMLPPSDNFFAETLLKDLGSLYGAGGTTAAGAAVVRKTIASLLGIHPRVVDGSGLSRADRTSPYQVADLLVALNPTPLGPLLRDHLAIAGHSGTLAERMRHTGAAGRCRAKTGTLTGASNLAGYCEASNGHMLAFAIFNDGVATAFAHILQDHMTITLADY
jgi:serine-type D-Ala-D-Ala carboxypeptidase/endopeptidase (penicillin-binding protein 4)